MDSSWMLPAVIEYLAAKNDSVTNDLPKQEEDNRQDPYAAILNVLICSVVLSMVSNKAKEDQNGANQNALAIEQQTNVMNSLMKNRNNVAPKVETSQDTNNALISAILRQHTQAPSNSAPQGISQLPPNLLLSALGNNAILGPIRSKSMGMSSKSTGLCKGTPGMSTRSESNLSQTKDLLEQQSPALPSISDKRQKGRPAIFIKELYEMLIALEKEPGGKKIASFLPDGDTFAIHEPEKLVNTVLPKYFRMKSISSFKRQLNMYGFRQVSAGSEKCAYYHELFIRDQPNLLQNIHRIKKKSFKPMIGAWYSV